MNSGEKTARTTIFHQLLRPDAAEDYVVPTVEELKDEAYILLAAAADTTGNALTIAAYNVAINPEISSRLTAELKETFPGPEPSMDFITLEKLPYLVSLCFRVRAMSILVNMLLDCGYQGSSTVNIPLSFVYIKKKKMTAHYSACHAVSLADFHVLCPSLAPSSMAIMSPSEYVYLTIQVKCSIADRHLCRPLLA